MNRRTLKRIVACLATAAMTVISTPVTFAERGRLTLTETSSLSSVEENGIQYILGAAIDGGWMGYDFSSQFESSSGAYNFDEYKSKLCTGYWIDQNGSKAIAVVKGDILGTGSSGLSQLVEMARLIADPARFPREKQLAADLNEDGRVTLSDLVLLARGDIHGAVPLYKRDMQYPVDTKTGVTVDVTNINTAYFDVVVKNVEASKVGVAAWGERHADDEPTWRMMEKGDDNSWHVTLNSADFGPTEDYYLYDTVLISIYADGEPVGSVSHAYTGPYVNGNKRSGNYNTASVIRYYIYENTLGGLTRIEAQRKFREDTNTVRIEEYDANFVLQTSRSIPLELPLWGGYFATESYNYLIAGERNDDENDSTEVVRVMRYDKNWNYTGSASIYGSNVETAFASGSLRCTEKDGWIYIVTGHRMYKSGDGKNHQARLMFAVNEATLEVADKYSFGGPGYTSHSFNQFILTDEDGNLVSLNHGDGFPRGLVMHKYSGTDGRIEETESNLFLTFPGNSGDNATGCSVGGFVETSDCYLSAYSYDGGKSSTDEPRDLYVSFIDKKSGSVRQEQITSEADVRAPHVVPLTDDTGYIMWNNVIDENSATLCYVEYRNGSVGKVHTVSDVLYESDDEPTRYANAPVSGAWLSDCEPILWNGKIVWYTSYNSPPFFYLLDESGVTAIAGTGTRG